MAGPIRLSKIVSSRMAFSFRKQQLPHGASAEPLSDVDGVKADAAIPDVGGTVGGHVFIDRFLSIAAFEASSIEEFLLRHFRESPPRLNVMLGRFED